MSPLSSHFCNNRGAIKPQYPYCPFYSMSPSYESEEPLTKDRTFGRKIILLLRIQATKKVQKPTTVNPQINQLSQTKLKSNFL